MTKKNPGSSSETTSSANFTLNIVDSPLVNDPNLLVMVSYAAYVLSSLNLMQEDQAFDWFNKLALDIEAGNILDQNSLDQLLAVMMEMAREKPEEGEHVQ